MLMVFWFFSSESYERRFKIRWKRVHQIERILGLDSHLRIDRESSKSLLKGQRFRCCMFIVYLVIALFVTCDMKVEVISWPIDWGIIKFVIRTETIIVGIVAVVFGVIYKINRNRIRPNP